MKATHTPGPWRVASSRRMNSRTFYIQDANANDLATTTTLRIAQEGRANANIMAAGPELLDALVMVRDADEDCIRDGVPGMPMPARAKLDAAIAKAEGRS